MRRLVEDRESEADTLMGRGGGVSHSDQMIANRQCWVPREKGRCVPIRAHAQQDEIESGPLPVGQGHHRHDLSLILRGRLLRVIELAVDAMGDDDREVLQKQRRGDAIIAVRMIGRNATFINPPDMGVGPRDSIDPRGRGKQLEQGARGGSARDGEMRHPPGLHSGFNGPGQ